MASLTTTTSSPAALPAATTATAASSVSPHAGSKRPLLAGDDAPWRATAATAAGGQGIRPVPRIHHAPVLRVATQDDSAAYALAVMKHPDPIGEGLAMEAFAEAAGPECIVPGQQAPLRLMGLKVWPLDIDLKFLEPFGRELHSMKKMPESDYCVESQTTATDTVQNNSVLPMDIQGPEMSQSQGAANKVVIDLENDTGKEKARMVMAPRSDVWNHFIKIKDDKGFLKSAKCKYCGRCMKAESKGHGTTSLARHLECCKLNTNKFEKDPKQGTIQLIQGKGVSTWRFDQDAFRKAFAAMVVEDELPFCFGERPGFIKFMARACPRFQLPSRRTCTRDIVQLYFQERARVKKFLKDSCQRVCLTTDCWTSQQQDGYMIVTASFIDVNWQLHKKVICFFKIKGRELLEEYIQIHAPH